MIDTQDALTRHQIFVLRYAKGREQEAADYFERMLDEVSAQVLNGVLYNDIVDYLVASNVQYKDILIQAAIEFGEQEAEFNYELLDQVVDFNVELPSPEQIQSAVYTSVFDLEPTKGYTIASMLDEFSDKKQTQIINFIRDGFALGETTQQITKRIKDNSELIKSQASTIARTVLNHTSIQARNVTMKQNTDVLVGYEWISTLDSRTSIICASRDGIVYEIKDSNPKPPAHFNCRSTISFAVKPEFDLGRNIKSTRASKGAAGPKQISESTTYEQFLRRQPKSFIYEVLGVTRGDLFINGRLNIGAFVDDSGKVLSLDELRAMRPLAFGSI